jgi:hypothetical protein
MAISKPAQHPAIPARIVPLNVTADGELELGERYTEPPKPLVWTGDGRLCTICKQPTMWRRPTSTRGAPVHPECETGFFDEITGDALGDIEFSLVEQLGAHTRTIGWHEPARTAPEDKRLGRADAGCEICRRPLRGLLDCRRSLALRTA